MFKLAIGFLIGVGVSVMHYDYGTSPQELVGIIIKHGNDIVEEVQKNSDGKQPLTDSILNQSGLLSGE